MKILSNNPERGSRNFTQPKRPGFRTSRISLPKISIRRLIKRDPAVGRSQPFFDSYTETRNVQGLSGPSSAGTRAKARTAAPGAGLRRIVNRGVNKKLKKR